jgi:hypothetical protein
LGWPSNVTAEFSWGLGLDGWIRATLQYRCYGRIKIPVKLFRENSFLHEF